MKKFQKLIRLCSIVVAMFAVFYVSANAVSMPVKFVGINQDLQVKIDEAKATQAKAHEMAELARELGFEESHEAIQSAKEIWHEEQETVKSLTKLINANREIEISFAPHVPTGLTADAFNVMLRGTAMAGTGAGFEAMEKATGTNGLFAIGVAGSESGIGAACYGYNPYGMLSGGGLIRYGSWESATMAFGQLIASRTYSRASTVSAINSIYCPGDGGYWTSKVNSFMQQKYNALIAAC